jgi:hypothetical protein
MVKGCCQSLNYVALVQAGRATYGRRFGTLLVNGINDSVVSYSDLVGFVPQVGPPHHYFTLQVEIMLTLDHLFLHIAYH